KKQAKPHHPPHLNAIKQRENSATTLAGAPPQIEGGNCSEQEREIAHRVDWFPPERRRKPLAIKINRRRPHFRATGPDRDPGLPLEIRRVCCSRYLRGMPALSMTSFHFLLSEVM